MQQGFMSWKWQRRQLYWARSRMKTWDMAQMREREQVSGNLCLLEVVSKRKLGMFLFLSLQSFGTVKSGWNSTEKWVEDSHEIRNRTINLNQAHKYWNHRLIHMIHFVICTFCSQIWRITLNTDKFISELDWRESYEDIIKLIPIRLNYIRSDN